MKIWINKPLGFRAIRGYATAFLLLLCAALFVAGCSKKNIPTEEKVADAIEFNFLNAALANCREKVLKVGSLKINSLTEVQPGIFVVSVDFNVRPGAEITVPTPRDMEWVSRVRATNSAKVHAEIARAGEAEQHCNMVRYSLFESYIKSRKADLNQSGIVANASDVWSIKGQQYRLGVPEYDQSRWAVFAPALEIFGRSSGKTGYQRGLVQ